MWIIDARWVMEPPPNPQYSLVSQSFRVYLQVTPTGSAPVGVTAECVDKSVPSERSQTLPRSLSPNPCFRQPVRPTHSSLPRFVLPDSPAIAQIEIVLL